TARHQTSEEPILPDGLFAFLSSGQRAGMSPPVALRLPGLQKRSPDKVRSTASGENYAMFAPLSPFNAK
ncbi:hypothetical protein, partial [Klebsiella pneumoniae]|uniref:hypothetical protein n=3 Tax=Klebsiella pneumoniae TaxID=573 RepID=UPI0031351F52